MTETAGRIRWTGDDETGEAIGCVGTLNPAAFRIWEASEGGEWLLASILPGHQGARTYGDNPEKPKAEAERWLAGFVSSLGAVFPGSGEALPQRDSRGMLDLTCDACGATTGTNCHDDDIRCAECGAHRCPHCGGWFGRDD